MLTLAWHEPDSPGWSCALPPSWFATEGQVLSLEHETISPGGKRVPAWCSLHVEGRHAFLDYGTGANAERNRKNGVYRDHLRLTFADEERLSLLQVEFLIDGELQPARVTIGNVLDLAAAEGDAKLVRHLSRERDSRLRRAKIEEVRASAGRLICEACGFDASASYAGIEEACEVHHRTEISQGPRISTTADLAVLCASCHGAIHKLRPMPSVEAFRDHHVRFKFVPDSP